MWPALADEIEGSAFVKPVHPIDSRLFRSGMGNAPYTPFKRLASKGVFQSSHPGLSLQRSDRPPKLAFAFL
jgi:hypothetical protein